MARKQYKFWSGNINFWGGNTNFWDGTINGVNNKSSSTQPSKTSLKKKVKKSRGTKHGRQ